MDTFVCFYCERLLIKKYYYSIDHIVPISKGGNKLAQSNRVGCCKGCNSFKGSLLPDEYVLKVHRQIAIGKPKAGLNVDFGIVLINAIRIKKLVDDNPSRYYYKRSFNP